MEKYKDERHYLKQKLKQVDTEFKAMSEITGLMILDALYTIIENLYSDSEAEKPIERLGSGDS